MREFSIRSVRAVGILLLTLVFLPAMPQGASAQDASAFIKNLGQQGLQVLGPSVPQQQPRASARSSTAIST